MLFIAKLNAKPSASSVASPEFYVENKPNIGMKMDCTYTLSTLSIHHIL